MRREGGGIIVNIGRIWGDVEVLLFGAAVVSHAFFFFSLLLIWLLFGGGREEAREGAGSLAGKELEVSERKAVLWHGPSTRDVGDPVEVAPVEGDRYHGSRRTRMNN